MKSANYFFNFLLTRFTASTLSFIHSYRNSSPSFFTIFVHFHDTFSALFKSPFFFCFYFVWISDAAIFFLVSLFFLFPSFCLINQSVSKVVYAFCCFTMFVIHSLLFSYCFCLNVFSLFSDVNLFSHLKVTFPLCSLIGPLLHSLRLLRSLLKLRLGQLFVMASSPCDRVAVLCVTDLATAELGSVITACR